MEVDLPEMLEHAQELERLGTEVWVNLCHLRPMQVQMEDFRKRRGK
jgi:hypothetical protein